MSVHTSMHLRFDSVYADDWLWGRVRALRTWIRQTACALGGHDLWLQTERDRIFLECITCGHQTPGWRLDVRRPRLTPVSRRRLSPMHAHTAMRATDRRCA